MFLKEMLKALMFTTDILFEAFIETIIVKRRISVLLISRITIITAHKSPAIIVSFPAI